MTESQLTAAVLELLDVLGYRPTLTRPAPRTTGAPLWGVMSKDLAQSMAYFQDVIRVHSVTAFCSFFNAVACRPCSKSSGRMLSEC